MLVKKKKKEKKKNKNLFVHFWKNCRLEKNITTLSDLNHLDHSPRCFIVLSLTCLAQFDLPPHVTFLKLIFPELLSLTILQYAAKRFFLPAFFPVDL